MKNKFVSSCQKNSKEVQEALFALGYTWPENDGKARYLDVQFVFTDEDGNLTHYFNNKASIPSLYDFTEETKLVATLIDSTPNKLLTVLRKELSENFHSPDVGDDVLNDTDKTHDWRNHVPEVVASVWSELTERERILVALVAELPASSEDWD